MSPLYRGGNWGSEFSELFKMIRAKTRLECTADLRESDINPVCGSEMQRLTVRFVNCRQGNKLQWLPE